MIHILHMFCLSLADCIFVGHACFDYVFGGRCKRLLVVVSYPLSFKLECDFLHIFFIKLVYRIHTQLCMLIHTFTYHHASATLVSSTTCIITLPPLPLPIAFLCVVHCICISNTFSIHIVACIINKVTSHS